jgi:chemotaxis family two-component system response regulator Rcp1
MTDPAQILLVEDSAEDIELTELALDEAGFASDLHVVRDGEQAMRFLRRESPYEDAVRPDFMLLDLNMPRKDGREVLREVKTDPALRRIPVVVLTTSGDDRDVLRAYDEHVNAYVRKPLGFDAMVNVAKQLEGFWVGIVCLPPEGDA